MPRPSHVIAALTCLLALTVATPASAATFLAVTPALPTTVNVGQRDLSAMLGITNVSTGAEATGNVTVTSIRLVPSCGNLTAGCSTLPDPGVFSVGSSGIGSAGSACAGVPFAISVSNMGTGEVTFTPPGPLVLGATGSSTAQCAISFAVNVLKAPTIDSSPSPGIQTNALASANGQASNGAMGGGGGSDTVTVTSGTGTLTATATSSATIGSSISDSATVTTPSGSPAATGAVTFRLFGHGDVTCSGPQIFQATAPLASASATTSTATSTAFTPSQPGTYRWIAAYSGDANWAPTTTACNEPGQTSTVDKATPTLAGSASPDTALGGPLSDSATLSNGYGTLAGTIDFRLYGPDDAACAGTPVFSSTVPLSGGSATSASFTPTRAGRYQWVASYSGDANNSPVSTACGDASQTRTVAKAVPMVTQTPSGTVAAGQVVSDVAHLSGGAGPAGTLAFRLYGPNDSTCSGTPLTTVTRTVTGNGNYSSGDAVAPTAGNYRWVVAYSGDANNAPVTTACGAANVAVTAVTPPPGGGTTTITPVAPTGLTASARPRRDRKLPFSYRIFGKLRLPATVTTAQGCLGKVSVQIKSASKTISTRTVTLKSDCSYTSRVTFRQRKRLRRSGGTLKVIVKFLGNARLSKISARTVRVRYG